MARKKVGFGGLAGPEDYRPEIKAMMIKRKEGLGGIARFCKKGNSQYEITISGGMADDYGMPANPPIVVCAKNKKSALRQFKFPKSVKVESVKKVS